jgi:hypothetical protein
VDVITLKLPVPTRAMRKPPIDVWVVAAVPTLASGEFASIELETVRLTTVDATLASVVVPAGGVVVPAGIVVGAVGLSSQAGRSMQAAPIDAA